MPDNRHRFLNARAPGGERMKSSVLAASSIAS